MGNAYNKGKKIRFFQTRLKCRAYIPSKLYVVCNSWVAAFENCILRHFIFCVPIMCSFQATGNLDMCAGGSDFPIDYVTNRQNKAGGSLNIGSQMIRLVVSTAFSPLFTRHVTKRTILKKYLITQTCWASIKISITIVRVNDWFRTGNQTIAHILETT